MHEAMRISFLTLLLAVYATAAAAQSHTRIEGGPGGQAFVDEFLFSQGRISEVRVGAGEWIDSLQVIYQIPDGRQVPNPRRGGRGGQVARFTLEPDERIIAISGTYGTYVQTLQIHTTKRTSQLFGGAPGPRTFRIDAPPERRVVGFAGRAGAYVDAIGLAYDAVREPPLAGPKPAPPGPVAGPAPQPAPAPSAPARPNGIDGKVDTKSTVDTVTFSFKLRAPAQPVVDLGRDPPRSGKCFSRSEVLASVQSPRFDKSHVVRITRLSINTDYHYVVRIAEPGGQNTCIPGRTSTATIIDRP